MMIKIRRIDDETREARIASDTSGKPVLVTDDLQFRPLGAFDAVRAGLDIVKATGQEWRTLRARGFTLLGDWVSGPLAPRRRAG